MTDPTSNNLRVNLYKMLFPKIIEEDLQTGVTGAKNYWDDPLSKWDEDVLWTDMGLIPILKNVFYAIETEEGNDLAILDQLTDLVDPDLCPPEFLDVMARSLGYALEDHLSDAGKRETIKSVMELNRRRGTALSWEVFYRMLGYKIKAVPLFKKNILEADYDYSRERYVTQDQTEVLGVAGSINYSGTLTQIPILPGSIRVTVGSKVYRDNSDTLSPDFGKLVSNDGSSGIFNYVQGKYQLTFATATPADVNITYRKISEEFPYQAARVELEVFYVLDEETEPIPLENEFIPRILTRLEEVRPIHVLVNLVILVMDAPEVLENFATDDIRCGPSMGKDVRADEFRFYMGDRGPCSEDNNLLIEEEYTSADDEKTCVLEDLTTLVTGPDILVIEWDGNTDYW